MRFSQKHLVFFCFNVARTLPLCSYLIWPSVIMDVCCLRLEIEFSLYLGGTCGVASFLPTFIDVQLQLKLGCIFLTQAFSHIYFICVLLSFSFLAKFVQTDLQFLEIWNVRPFGLLYLTLIIKTCNSRSILYLVAPPPNLAITLT